MTAIVLPETAALMERAAPLMVALRQVAILADVHSEASALIASGMKVQTLLDGAAEDLEIVSTMEVTNQEEADDMLGRLGRLQTVFSDSSGEIEAERKKMVGPFNAVVKIINAGYGAPVKHGGGIVLEAKRKLVAFAQEQERLRAAAEAAEVARRAAAAQAAAEAEAKAAADASALLAASQQAHDAGASTAAAELAQQAAQVADSGRAQAAAAAAALHAPIAVSAGSVKGARAVWSASVTNFEQLVLHVADRVRAGDRSLLGLLEANARACSAKAALEKEGFNVPGLRADRGGSVSVRKAAA